MNNTMDDIEFVNQLNKRLKSGRLPTKVLLNKLRVLTIDLKAVYFLSDPYYLPFYYYLGLSLPSINVLHFGFNQGHIIGSFLLGCRTVKNLLAYEEPTEQHYSPRQGINTLKPFFKGNAFVHSGDLFEFNYQDNLQCGKWDTMIISNIVSYDRYMCYLKTCWDHIDENGLIFIDRIKDQPAAKQSLYDFAKIKNRKAHEVFSKFGVGMIRK